MSTGAASTFRAGLELTGGITMSIAIGTSLLVQTNVWGAVRSTGEDNEDDDYKIRTEHRRLQEMKQLVERQEVIVAKLREAHAVLHKEKEDVAAMYRHGQPDMDCSENPLHRTGSESSESSKQIVDSEVDEVAPASALPEVSAQTSKDS